MNGRAAAGIAIGAAVAVAVAVWAGISIYDVPADVVDADEEDRTPWNTAGAFGINRHSYKLGQDIFFAGSMLPDQQVIIRVATPENKVFFERFYNGAERESVKFYFKPDTSVSKGIYTKDELVGRWMIWFEGINNDEIYFEVVDEFVPGAETDIVDIRRPGAEADAMIGPVMPPP